MRDMDDQVHCNVRAAGSKFPPGRQQPVGRVDAGLAPVITVGEIAQSEDRGFDVLFLHRRQHGLDQSALADHIRLRRRNGAAPVECRAGFGFAAVKHETAALSKPLMDRTGERREPSFVHDNGMDLFRWQLAAVDRYRVGGDGL